MPASLLGLEVWLAEIPVGRFHPTKPEHVRWTKDEGRAALKVTGGLKKSFLIATADPHQMAIAKRFQWVVML